MKEINPQDFKADRKTVLKEHSTLPTFSATEEELESLLGELREKLSKWQDKMYAHNRYSVLICLQGIDTSGKDSLIREVFKEINPRGVVVHSFKTPTSTELEHDFLWRHYSALPERGKIAVFNRTHYENVLVTRVHPEYILNENLPDVTSVNDISEDFWQGRLDSIRNFENHIASNGTIVLKFFLHLSKEEQRQRLLRRLEKPKHNWKFSEGDLKERALWDDYQKYNQIAISETSQEHAPWFVIPADDKMAARYIVAKIIRETLKAYEEVKNPELDQAVQQNIAKYRSQLETEK